MNNYIKDLWINIKNSIRLNCPKCGYRINWIFGSTDVDRLKKCPECGQYRIL